MAYAIQAHIVVMVRRSTTRERSVLLPCRYEQLDDNHRAFFDKLAARSCNPDALFDEPRMLYKAKTVCGYRGLSSMPCGTDRTLYHLSPFHKNLFLQKVQVLSDFDQLRTGLSEPVLSPKPFEGSKGAHERKSSTISYPPCSPLSLSRPVLSWSKRKNGGNVHQRSLDYQKF